MPVEVRVCAMEKLVCLPIMKSQPVKSFHENVHSSSLEESFEFREFSAILGKQSVHFSKQWARMKIGNLIFEHRFI